MDVYHITVIARGTIFDEDRHSIDSAKSWAADKLRELGAVPEAIEYHKQGDRLVAEPDDGVRVTISPR